MSSSLLSAIASSIDDNDFEWMDQDRVFVNTHARVQFRIKRPACLMWQEWFNDYHRKEYRKWMLTWQ